MHKVDAAGLKVDSITKQELINTISDRTKAGHKTFVITPYSEFLYQSLKNPEIFEVLNKADFSVPDGIGLFWARKFLTIPFSAKSYYGKIVQAFWQMVYSGAAIIFYPQWVKSAFVEKISGSDLIWDLAKLASEEQKTIYLLGGFGDTPKLVKDKLIAKFPNLIVAGYTSKNPDDPTIIDDIKQAKPDFLLVAFGPIKQEQWIAQHINELPCKLFIGLGGTFDYLAGKKFNPPARIRSAGLEWLYRLVTQPYRIKRIWQATVGLTLALIKFKVFRSMPYRKNVVAVIINKENKVLVVRVNSTSTHPAASTFGNFPENYWVFPQGGVDDDNIIEGARREAREETGITSLTYIKTSPQIHEYFFRKLPPFVTSKRYQFKGQIQHVVYFYYTGQDSEIKLDNWELVEYKWVPVAEVNKILHPLKHPLGKIVQSDLKVLL